MFYFSREHSAGLDRSSWSAGEAERGACAFNHLCSNYLEMNTNLHPAYLQLEKHMRADSLNDKISHRPPPEKLLQEGVLHDDPRSPEEKYAEAIEDEYAKREGGA